MVSKPKLRLVPPASIPRALRHPPELEDYLSAAARVQIIAQKRYRVKLNDLIKVPLVQEFLREQGLSREPLILRCQLEECHWKTLAEWLQRKEILESIRRFLSE